jgi:hypothetical protein
MPCIGCNAPGDFYRYTMGEMAWRLELCKGCLARLDVFRMIYNIGLFRAGKPRRVWQSLVAIKE